MPKIKWNIKQMQAVAVMVGYIVGVGMFGLPYLTAKAGLFAFFGFLIGLGFLQYFIHLAYANLIIATESYHRLPGYVEKYLGKKAKTIVFVAKIVGNYGALLAYFILIGIFLNELLYPLFGGSPYLYTTAAFIISASIVYFGIGIIAEAELIMSFFLILIILLMTVRGFFSFETGNFLSVNWKYSLLPYGAMLMALDGSGSLPIVAKILKKDAFLIKRTIRASMLVSIAITVLFTLTVVGVSGSGTTADALTGVKTVIQGFVITLALVFGVFTMFTSIIGVSESIKETYIWDYKVPAKLSWFLSLFVPYVFFICGLNDLILVISFAGAIAGGISAIMLIVVFMKMRKSGKGMPIFKVQPHNYLSYIIIFFLSMGIIYEVYYFIEKLIN